MGLKNRSPVAIVGAGGAAKNQFVSQWTSLARHGRLGPTHGHMFELEPLTMDDKEKSLVIVGDSWEWPTHSRRALSSVVEASLLYVRFDTILNKFLSNLSMIPAVRILRLRYNDLTTLLEVRCICEALENTSIEHLIIQDTPISKFSYLEAFVAAILPQLTYFNTVSIFAEDKGASDDMLRNFIRIPSIESKVADHCSIPVCVGISQPQGTRRVSCFSYVPTDDGRIDKDIAKDLSPIEKLKMFWVNCSKTGQRMANETIVDAQRKSEALRNLPQAFHKVVGQTVHDLVEGLVEYQSI